MSIERDVVVDGRGGPSSQVVAVREEGEEINQVRAKLTVSGLCHAKR